ncbi:Scaffold-type E3 ligase [Apiotrichum porosum]|uniref:Defective in cullin neddylation protein n=1 Tax=Apiotrichum porosum TaxID=105984 RepID=A0A427XJT2_9TREE|nr:Scaffold-type E3 ligase [Apiotrichum porosum]RSH79120.1 Scaffold-type E3 ligase [Apiotrichum porosum]
MVQNTLDIPIGPFGGGRSTVLHECAGLGAAGCARVVPALAVGAWSMASSPLRPLRSLADIVRLYLVLTLVAAILCYRLVRWLSHTNKQHVMAPPLTKSAEKQLIAEFRDVTGTSATDAAKFLKKYKYDLHRAINGYLEHATSGGGSASSSADNAKKIGDIWERFKDASNPKLVTIEGTMALCEELDIDPASDSVLFCLASDLGSKATGEWEKEPFVQGWLSIDSSINSIAKMKAALPTLRTKLNSNAEYFKKVYMHTFDLCKAPGARVLALETAIDMWSLYIPPALHARPSALSRVPTGSSPTGKSTDTPAEFGDADLDLWLDFMREKNRAVSKDTWSLFIDFVRTIDAAYTEYDDEAAWPSTIDDFVEYARANKAKA